MASKLRTPTRRRKGGTGAKRSLHGYALVLGAGASYGAAVGERRPPLDSTFLREAKEILGGRGRKRKGGGKIWATFAKALDLAGASQKNSIDWRLEDLATYLEARANMPSLQHSPGKPAKYENALPALAAVICHTLRKRNGTKPCGLHKALIALVQPSCVVTFNYDLIVDCTLMAMGKLAWFAEDYAGKMIFLPGKWGRTTARQTPRRDKLVGEIPLLKLHGSINWAQHQRGGGFSLVLDKIPSDDSLPCSSCPDHALVVPPIASKVQIRDAGLLAIWKKAGGLLRKAKGWILWGYSFPRTDTITHVLLSTALGRNKRPKPVVVINPDLTVGERVGKQLRKVKVQQWTSVERFLYDHERLQFAKGKPSRRRAQKGS
jgi:hypothetical protein